MISAVISNMQGGCCESQKLGDPSSPVVKTPLSVVTACVHSEELTTLQTLRINAALGGPIRIAVAGNMQGRVPFKTDAISFVFGWAVPRVIVTPFSLSQSDSDTSSTMNPNFTTAFPVTPLLYRPLP